MNFVHLSVLAGLAVAGIPLLLHLLGRREPQVIDFPTLRFVQQTRLEDSTSWQLRHFLLLLLRVLLILILVFAIARPRVHSAMMGSIIGISGLVVLACLATLMAAVARVSHRPASVWGTILLVAILLWLCAIMWSYRSWTTGPALPSADSSAPVAVAIILDTSPSMAYQASNQSRLQAAKEMASWLLDRLPADSHVGVLSGIPMQALSLDPRAANGQVSLIEKTSELVDLSSRLRTAMNLVLADDLERKEIYLLTDMNNASWKSVPSDLLNLIQQNKDRVLIQLIDVGVQHTVNWQLGDPELDYHTLPVGGDLTVSSVVTRSTTEAAGPASTTVELWQESIDPRLPVITSGQLQLPESRVAAREMIELDTDGSAPVSLIVRNLSEGVHHFTLRMDKQDPLLVDNERFITVTVKRQQPTLIVSDNSDVLNILPLIAAPGIAASKERDTETDNNANLITTLRYSQLPQAVLTRYSVIVLYDVPTLSKRLVESLREHVQGGGGLLIVLGPGLESSSGSGAEPIAPRDASDPESAQLGENTIVSLLPGSSPRLATRNRSDRSVFWQPTAVSHPVYQALEFPANEIAWQLMPVFKSWSFQALDSDTMVLATLSSSQDPLLTAQSLGRGQILTLTTPIPDLESAGRPLWNELWIAEQYWWAFGILSGSIRTLSGSDQTPLTFRSADTVNLSNDTREWPSRWEMYSPSAERTSLESFQGSLNVGVQTLPGNYHLRGRVGVPVARGFSVNIPAEHTQLQRMELSDLDTILGEGCYRVSLDQDDVASSVGQARFGQELYPLLMLFVSGVFLAEQFMSNRFYSISLKLGKGKV